MTTTFSTHFDPTLRRKRPSTKYPYSVYIRHQYTATDEGEREWELATPIDRHLHGVTFET